MFPKREAKELPECGSCHAKELKMIFLNKDGKYFKHFNKYRPQLVALHFLCLFELASSLRNIDMVKPEITQVSLANHYLKANSQ